MTHTVDAIRAQLTEIKSMDRDHACTMIPPYYTSPDFLELEKQHIFRKEWVCLGHSGEIPEPGDYFATELVGEQLLVVRTKTGEINVLSNVCRHRGNILAQGSGNKKRFTCAYHAWTYDAQGQLKSAPHMDEAVDFDMAGCKLPTFKSTVWKGFIYVNLDGTASPLEDRLEVLSDIIKNYRMEDRNFVYGTEDAWQTNWKCLVENFMEGYHLTPTHQRTLHPITPTALCKKMTSGEYHTGYWSGYDPRYPERKPYPEGLTPEERRKSPMFWVSPNHVLGLATNICVYMCLRPAGVDKVAIRWGLLSTDVKGSKVATDYIDLANAFNAEDKVKLETLQLGLQSQYLQPGRLAPDDYEGTIWDIYQFMAKRLGADVSLSE